MLDDLSNHRSHFSFTDRGAIYPEGHSQQSPRVRDYLTA